MELTEIALRAVGAFYVFAGYIASRAGLTSHAIDHALAALTAEKPAVAERRQTEWLLATSVLLMAGGAALVLLWEGATWLFLASAAGQVVYLYWLAPRYFDVHDPPDPQGRQQSTNAFAIYIAATAFVGWAFAMGKLSSWQEIPTPLLAIASAGVVGWACYVAWTYAGWSLRGRAP